MEVLSGCELQKLQLVLCKQANLTSQPLELLQGRMQLLAAPLMELPFAWLVPPKRCCGLVCPI